MKLRQPDLPVGNAGPNRALLQAISKELVAGDPKIYPRRQPLATSLCRATKSASWSKGAVGYSFLILDACDRLCLNTNLIAAASSAHTMQKPHNAVWHKKGESSDGKEGLYLVDIDGNPGNRIEETIYARVLVLPDDGGAPFVVTQAYKSTAKSIGADMLRRRLAKSTARTPILSPSNGG